VNNFKQILDTSLLDTQLAENIQFTLVAGCFTTFDNLAFFFSVDFLGDAMSISQYQLE
jgi:hypothetical protein